MLQQIKKDYQNIEIPDNYHQKVQEAINYGNSHQKKKSRKHFFKMVFVTCCLFIFVLNTSPVFAATLAKIPYLGDLCQILTFIHIHEEDAMKIIHVNAPSLSKTGYTQLEKKINTEIQIVIDQEVQEASARAKDYYQAYIETGGKVEDFIPVSLDIDYDVKYQKDYLISFLIEKTEILASSYQEYLYYNIDLKEGKVLSLEDLVGKDYQKKITNEIKRQIALLSQEEQYYYFDDINIEDFINPQRIFYINEKGQLVIKFQKYEIAAGAAGPVEFIMPDSFLMNGVK